VEESSSCNHNKVPCDEEPCDDGGYDSKDLFFVEDYAEYAEYESDGNRNHNGQPSKGVNWIASAASPEHEEDDCGGYDTEKSG
jgi:hypothetical protein